MPWIATTVVFLVVALTGCVSYAPQDRALDALRARRAATTDFAQALEQVVPPAGHLIVPLGDFLTVHLCGVDVLRQQKRLHGASPWTDWGASAFVAGDAQKHVHVYILGGRLPDGQIVFDEATLGHEVGHPLAERAGGHPRFSQQIDRMLEPML